MKTITIGNPEGVGKKYSVEIGSSSYAGSQIFIVNDVFSEQEALDAAVDYCEEHGWNGLFWDNEEQAQEYPEDYITAGNHGHLLPSNQVIVHSLNESKKQTIKLNESTLRQIVAESVKNIIKEYDIFGRGMKGHDASVDNNASIDREQQAIMNWNQNFDSCSNQLMKIKQEVWRENGGRNTPLLELAFNLYKLCSFAKGMINKY